MEKFRFALFSIVVLALIGLIGYWAIGSLQSGSEHVASQKIKDLQKENEDLKDEMENLQDELAGSQSELEGLIPKEVTEEPAETPEPKSAQTTYKHQSLIDELQKLALDGILMKQKSSGTRVGTVQKFLNIYNKTSNRVDNDYGASTVKAVTAFQKAVGLKANGEAGPTTFNKMIEWLKKQS
jgi:murein L,D-transpeptidase YcbB/YkuD